MSTDAELLERILKQLESHTKILSAAFDINSAPKMGFSSLPDRGRKVVNIAVIPDESENIFRIRNPKSLEKTEENKWEMSDAQSIFGRISNASVYHQKAAKSSHNDADKLYLFFDVGNEIYSVRTGINSYFVRGLISVFKGMTDDQLRSPIYFSGTNDSSKETYNAKVLFAHILDESGTVYREPEDKRTKDEKNNDWKDGSVQYCRDFVERIRGLNDTVVDPLMLKRLTTFLDSSPAFDLVAEKKAQMEDDAYLAKYGEWGSYANHLMDKYLGK